MYPKNVVFAAYFDLSSFHTSIKSDAGVSQMLPPKHLLPKTSQNIMKSDATYRTNLINNKKCYIT